VLVVAVDGDRVTTCHWANGVALEATEKTASAREVAALTVRGELVPPTASLARTFTTLMPKLKNSGTLSYVIFDLPPVGQSGLACRLAASLDKTLLVVEAEKTRVEKLEEARRLLLEANANTSIIFNKERHYLPRWLDPDQKD
jgi:hypothetical protein